MSFLDGMKEIVRQYELPRHPVSGEDISVRYTYALGVALLLIQSDEEFNNLERSWFWDFCRSLELPEEHCRKIVCDAENVGPDILHKMVPQLSDPSIRRNFLRDLHKATSSDADKKLCEVEMIDMFQRLLYPAETEQYPYKQCMEATTVNTENNNCYICSKINNCNNRLQSYVGSNACYRSDCSDRNCQ